jgi:hypothetical protein
MSVSVFGDLSFIVKLLCQVGSDLVTSWQYGSIQEWRGSSGVNSEASFLKEKERVSCS